MIVPHELDLTPLRRLWCRGPAELDTLRSLVSPTTWSSYRPRAGSSPRPHLFFRRWTFVERVDLADDRAHIQFNPYSRTPGSFAARLDFDLGGGQLAEWKDDAFSAVKYGPASTLTVTLPETRATYSVRLTLDGHLAYGGSYTREVGLLDLF